MPAGADHGGVAVVAKRPNTPISIGHIPVSPASKIMGGSGISIGGGHE